MKVEIREIEIIAEHHDPSTLPRPAVTAATPGPELLDTLRREVRETCESVVRDELRRRSER